MKKTILLVDREPELIRKYQLLIGPGYDYQAAHSRSEAMARLNNGGGTDLMIADAFIAGISAMAEWLKEVKSARPQMPIIVLSPLEISEEKLGELGAAAYVNSLRLSREELADKVSRCIG